MPRRTLIVSLRFAASLLALGSVGSRAEAGGPASPTLRCDGPRRACEPELAGAAWVEEYGSFRVFRPGPGRTAPVGQAGRRSTPISERLHLGTFAFDPLAGDPAERLDSTGGSGTPGGEEAADYVVQFAAPIRQEWLDELRAAGLELVQYVPHRAFLVHGSAAAVDRARLLERVRAVVRYQPAHKLPAELLWAVGAPLPAGRRAHGRDGRASYDLAVAKSATRAPLEAAVAAHGGRVLARLDLPSNYFDLLRVELPPEAVAALAARSGVLRIDPYVPPVAEDERAAQIVAGNYTNPTTLFPPGYDPATQFGADGSGVTVAIADDGIGIPGDGGFYITISGKAVDGPLRGAPSGALGHGHLNATIVAGATPFGTLDPAGYNYGLGVAPGAHLVNIPILCSAPGYCASLYTGTDADAANDAIVTAGPNGSVATISNNSWGDGTNGNAYDALAAAYDGFARDASAAGSIDPLFFVFSAGNSGSAGLTRPKMAKNVVAVANSENLRTHLSPSANNLEEMNSSSSRGPAADGRIKPDLTAPGTAIAGGRSGTPLCTIIDSAHCWSTGTSHAAPQVAGAAALFTQAWKESHSGDLPSPAMIKAALINGAVEVTGAGATSPIPNGDEGWGRAQVGNVLGPGARVHDDETSLLDTPGDESILTFEVADGALPLRATLTWSDPPALGDPALVNDLDLELIGGGQLYRGNNFSAGVSVAGGSANDLDNVENVFLPAGALAAGSVLAVRVRASALNGDGALGEGDATDQRFALVVSNAVPTSAPVLVAEISDAIAESCAPANTAPDPGEYLSYSLCLENIGNAPTVDLVAVLEPGPNVEPVAGARSYGVLAAGGGSSCQSFEAAIPASATCGEAGELTFALTDDGAPLPPASAALQLGAPVVDPPVTVSNPGAIAIPDEGTATPYPSELVVADDGTIVDLDLLLDNLGHTNPADIDLRLASPSGVAAMLLSDIGGTGNISNKDITLDDEASGPLPESLTSGSFRPTDLEPGDALPAPAPAANAPAAMSSFDGDSPIGTWKLYVFDDLVGDSGSIGAGWSLRLTLAHPVCATDCPLLFADGFELGDESRWDVP